MVSQHNTHGKVTDFCMNLSVSHLIVVEFCPLFFTSLLYFTGGCRHLFMHSFLKVQSQHFSQVEAWTVTGPLQQLDSFLAMLL